MFPDRRKFLALAGASFGFAALPVSPVSANTATRRYAVSLGRKQVGETSVRLTRSGGRVDVEIEVSLRLNILGLIRFDYTLSNRESWREGILQELRSTTDNNGKPEEVYARRTSHGLEINGSKYQGFITENPATTSYFTTDFLGRSTWINTQNGEVFQPSIGLAGPARFATNEGEVPCTKYVVRGGVDIDLYYDEGLEWMGSSFNVVGRKARIAMTARGGSLNRIWAG
ncbi:MAG: DUF6134 family protein [Rhodobacteraceae bacterium]|nr:DUF6134 family protein [Paracoccaceae bacterium]